MIYPTFRTKSNGVPILSKLEIDNITECCLRNFCPEALKTPQPIDEDRFLMDYLNLTQDFQFLTHCGAYLGMMVFDDSNKITVFDPSTNRAEYISAKKGTVIIDNTLLEEGQEHRYRFTAIHEAGHWLLHRNKFCRDLGQVSLFDIPREANVKCRAASIEGKVKPLDKWNDDDSMEWQANYFSSALLMPKSMVIQVCNDTKIINRLEFQSFGFDFMYNSLLADEVARIFNVSHKAAEVRLSNLNLIRNENSIQPDLLIGTGISNLINAI